MNCHCCGKFLKRILGEAGVEIVALLPAGVELRFDPGKITHEEIIALIEQEGFELAYDKEDQLIERIKSAVIDLVHHSTFNAMVRNSDYLVEKFNLSYQHISGIFSKHEHITLEKFIIRQKIDKAKELIQQGDLTLSEIAYMMGYSSVQYLSTQFKAITGISVSDFKKSLFQQDN
ncbi:MAG: helix-turn-helix transcriptional regulator [Bacteroidales bacterium]|nr:helix-turn-helix transcriptional regulator [Bacteroidales bacterium]